MSSSFFGWTIHEHRLYKGDTSLGPDALYDSLKEAVEEKVKNLSIIVQINRTLIRNGVSLDVLLNFIKEALLITFIYVGHKSN